MHSLLCLNVPGIYFEPRSESKSHDEAYRVIWLPSRSLAEAKHACKTCINSLGLIRLRHKYGVRVLAEHEESVFKSLKPESVFVATQVQRIFQIFPLPHGIQKGGVAKLLSSIKWTAKPLQPGRSQAKAMSWQVGSSEAPPVLVFSAFGEEVLITEMTQDSKPKQPPRFLASQKTHQHLKAEAASSSSTPLTGFNDRFLGGKDPWANVSLGGPPLQAPVNGTSGKTHLQEMTKELRSDLQDFVREEVERNTTDDSMEVQLQDSLEHQDQRLKKLETTMTELQAQNQQFGQWLPWTTGQRN